MAKIVPQAACRGRNGPGRGVRRCPCGEPAKPEAL